MIYLGHTANCLPRGNCGFLAMASFVKVRCDYSPKRLQTSADVCKRLQTSAIVYKHLHCCGLQTSAERLQTSTNVDNRLQTSTNVYNHRRNVCNHRFWSIPVSALARVADSLPCVPDLVIIILMGCGDVAIRSTNMDKDFEAKLF